MRKFYKFIKVFFKPLALMVLPVKFIDKQKLPPKKSGAYITICNHLSYFDVAYQTFYMHDFRRYLGKKDFNESKFIGWFFRSMGTIYVDRDKPAVSVIRECVDTLKGGDILSIFPEGTRNKVNEDLQEFKAGSAMFAIRAKVKIIPLIIYKKPKAFHSNYVAVGDAIDLSEFYDKPVTHNNMEIADKKIKDSMDELKEYTNFFVANKLWKKKNKHILDAFLSEREAKKVLAASSETDNNNDSLVADTETQTNNLSDDKVSV